MPSSGWDNCTRMTPASIPANSMKMNAVVPYKTPMRLWSTVVIQLQMPE